MAREPANWGTKAVSSLAQLLLIMVTVVGCSAAEVGAGPSSEGFELRASHSPDRKESFQLQGAELRSGVFIFVAAPSDEVEQVEFYIDTVSPDEAPLSVANVAPFDLAHSEDGRSEDGRSRRWDVELLGAGTHRLRAEVHLRDGSVRRTTATFSVVLDSTQPERELSPMPQPGPEPAPIPQPSPKPAAPAPSGTIWQPTPGTSWQWQLTGRIDTSVDAQVFDVDLFDVPVATIDELHRLGRKVICYFSGGSYEAWRTDHAQFPAAARGKKMDGWDELWLDVRRIDLLSPVMLARLDLAAEKGCDAVEPDNVDGYQNDTGFSISYADQLAYNKFLAREAHARGLAIGLKNDLEQILDLVDYFDFAVNEECFSWNECHMLTPFVAANKAVFGAEYEHAAGAFCPVTSALNLDFIHKDLNLGTTRQSCR